MSHEKGVITLFPCFMGKAHLLLPWRLLLPQASKSRGSQQFSILLNIQPFNSFHPDATETQPVFCLCLPSAWLRSVFSWPTVPYHTSGVTFFFFFLATSQWVSSTAHPPYSTLAEGCLAVYSSESLNKSACNWGEAKELEEEKRETKTATGESVSISCRWSRDAIQLLLVLLLLLLRKESGGEKGRGYYSRREREWEKKLVLESVSVREKTLRTKERRCSAEDNQRGRNRERERELQTEGVMEGERERQREREGGWKKYRHVYAYTGSVTML